MGIGDICMYKTANRAKLRTLNLLKDLSNITSAESGINALRGGKATNVLKGHIDLSIPMHERYGFATPESMLSEWRYTKQRNASLSNTPKTRAEENMRNYTDSSWSNGSSPSFSTFNAQRPQRHVRDAYKSLKDNKEFNDAFSDIKVPNHDAPSYTSQLNDYVTKSINNNPELQRLFRTLRLYTAKNKLAGKFGISDTPDDIYEYTVPFFTNRKLQMELKKFNQSPGLMSDILPELFRPKDVYSYRGVFLPVVQKYNANKPFGAIPHLQDPTNSLRIADIIDTAADGIKREGRAMNNKTLEQEVGRPFRTNVTAHTGESYPADRRDTLAHTIMSDIDPDYEYVIRKGAEGNPAPGQKYVVDIPITEWLFRRAGRDDVLSRSRIDLYTGQGDLDRTLFKGTGLKIPHKFYDDGSHSEFVDAAKDLGAQVDEIAPNYESALNASSKMRENMPKEELHDYLNLDWLPTWPDGEPLWLTPGAGTATGYALKHRYPFSKDLKWIPVDSKDIEDVLTHAGGPVSLDEVFGTFPEQLQVNISKIIKNNLKARQYLADTLPKDRRAINEMVNALKSQVKSNRFPQQAVDLMQGNKSLFGQLTQPNVRSNGDWKLELQSLLKD